MANSCENQPPPSAPLAPRWLLHTCESPAEQLALDHALLETADADPAYPEVLRVWESPSPFVVLGRSSRFAEEVNRAECERLGVPVLRRVSGGASIVTGPGCLMYSLLLDLTLRPELRMIDQAHLWVLARLCDALRPLEPAVRCAGSSDLVFERDGVLVKCSGNSLRVGRHRVLYHGTLMYDFDLSLVSNCLLEPPRQPDYRKRRRHAAFVTNLDATRDALTAALREGLGAAEPLESPPLGLASELAAKTYARSEWTHQR